MTWVKIALPALGLILFSSLFLLSNTTDPDDALPLAGLDPDQVASEQRLSFPRFASTLADGRELTLIADSAVQTSQQSNQIELEDVWVDLEMLGDGRALLRSDTGTVFLAEEYVDLFGDVLAQTDDGYTMRSAEMTIETGGEALTITSNVPVAGTGPDFKLDAGAMVITGPPGAEVAHFTQGVRLIYERPNEEN